jgi:foldase protein PrsA
MKQPTVPLTLCAALVTAAAVVACGDKGGVPGDAVATVDGVAIEQRSFDHWLAITAKTNGKPRAEVRDQVVGQLVNSAWIEGEAEDRGVSVDDAAVRRDFERQKRLSFRHESEFERYLESSGQTNQDILERVRLDLLTTRIRDQVTGGEEKVAQQQIADYYERNRESFRQREQRDLRVVVAPTRAKAAAARAALGRGVPWGTVVRRHSIDRASRSDGGMLHAVTRAEQDRRLGDAVFEARQRVLSGPVKARDGYYVFEVTRVFRPRQQSLEEARPAIERLLVSERRREQLDAFTEQFRTKWRSRTECREGYVTPDCKNGPDTAPTTAQQAGAAQP